jgi:hypothetical protein
MASELLVETSTLAAAALPKTGAALCFRLWRNNVDASSLKPTGGIGSGGEGELLIHRWSDPVVDRTSARSHDIACCTDVGSRVLRQLAAGLDLSCGGIRESEEVIVDWTRFVGGLGSDRDNVRLKRCLAKRIIVMFCAGATQEEGNEKKGHLHRKKAV